MKETMNPIETKEIRGLSIKALATIIVSTASIVGTVLGTYYSLNTKIESVRMENVSTGKLNELKLQQIDLQTRFLQAQIDQIRADFNSRSSGNGK